MNLADRTVPALVAQQAAQSPDAPAIVDGDLSVSYAEIESQSDALSAYIRSLGLAPDAAVGVCMHRCAAAIMSALAVMKSGAAYLPLNPVQPPDRLISALRDARADIVLITGEERFSGRFDGLRVVHVDNAKFTDLPGTAVEAAHLGPADLAYVIYTSGSSGRPKAVEITHAGLTNLIDWHRSAFGVRPTDRASHIAASGFDAAIWEVWPYLSAGASIHIASDAVARDPRALADWWIANDITIAFAASPIAERVVDFDYPPNTALRILLTGADVLHRFPPPSLPFALYNNYGPTETTIVATSGKVESATVADRVPSIGRPIDKTEVFIVDDRGVPQGTGVEGEICIAGVGLARGYRGDPQRTARQFAPIAVAGRPPLRAYHTGDRGRRSADGRIEFIGRIDDQMKIRGIRIEPSEVEAALNAYPHIRESAALVRSFGPGDDRLVAYVALDPGSDIVRRDLQTFLAQRLPPHLIPSTFVPLAVLPLTSNGKVDRAQLRVRDIDTRAGIEPPYLRPRGATEHRLMRIVARLLKLERVSADADFFLLGGHSLLATQLIARVRDTFGVAVGLRFLFESPTISALAAEVERLGREPLTPMNAGPRPRAFVASSRS